MGPLTGPDVLESILEFMGRPERLGEYPALYPFADDEVLVCGIENPEVCDSCQ